MRTYLLMTARLILFGSTAAFAAPAGSAAVQRPVFPVTGKASTYERRLTEILLLDEDDMLALAPRMNGMLFCGCPNCTGGAQDGQMRWLGIADPDRVRCAFCKMIFPNDAYPMDRTMTVVNRRGEQEVWRYHESRERKDQHFFLARARYFAKEYMADKTFDLAAAYALTGQQLYARRAALLLYRFSQVYPGWCVVHDYPAPGRKYPLSEAKPPYPYWAGIWNRWHLYDTPTEIARAYDLIYASGEIERVAAEKGVDLRRRLEYDLLRADIEFQRTYGGKSDAYSLVAPQRSAGFILVGRVVNEPDYVHDGLQRLRNFCAADFHFDGMHKFGTVAYHEQMIGNCTIAADLAKGYSDPPGYAWPNDGRRLDNVDVATELPMLARARTVPAWFAFPDRRVVAVHDTWSKRRFRAAERVAEPFLLPAYGHGRLATGQGEAAMQAHLHFSGGNIHKHLDNLSLILFARGQELLSDIGYTHTRWRFWVSQTPSHNTVAVDGGNHVSAGRSGDLQLYTVTDGVVQAIEATQPHSYPGVTTEFRRRLILVRVSDTDAYLVDVFRVGGGSRHEYFLHGHCERPQSVAATLSFEDVQGTLLGPSAKVALPERESGATTTPDGRPLAYAMFRNLREARTDGPFEATWRFEDGPAAGLRSHFAPQSGCTVVLAETPQIRPVQTWPHGEDDGKLSEFWRPSLVLRREGEAGLCSTFVAVHEPFSRTPFLRSVSWVTPASPAGPDGPVAVAVQHSAGTDIIVSCVQPGGVAVDLPSQWGLQCKGRIAVARVRDDRCRFAYLYDGQQLSVGGLSLRGVPGVTGRITAVERDPQKGAYGFTVDRGLPQGNALRGRTIVVTHPDGATHGYEIASVEPHGQGSQLNLATDPGFEYVDGKTRFPFFPPRELEGDNRFRIDGVTLVRAEGVPE